MFANFEKIRNNPNIILRGSGEDDLWKKAEAKISWHCPFKLSACDLLACSIEVGVEYLEDVGKGDHLSPRGLAPHTEGDLSVLPTIFE